MKTCKVMVLSFLLSLASCAQLRSVSTTTIPPQRGEKVQAEGYRFIFLLLNFNNRFVDNMAQDLANQCPGGRVEGILTKDEVLTYFPLIAHAYRVTATGYCIPVSKRKRG